MVDKSEKVVWLARLGYVARGAVYVLLGYLALSSSGNATLKNGQSGALAYIHDIPGGTIALCLAAAGLLGYAMFRVSTALLDTEHHGNTVKGIGVRIGHACSALVHFGLAWTALQLARGAAHTAGGSSQDMARTALSFDLGGVAIGLVGLGLIAAGVFQATSAATLDFMKRVSSQAPSWTCWLGRIGYATRALVFAIMGWSLLRSAWFDTSSEVRSLGSAIVDLRENGPIYSAVAAGLILFGVFSVIVARYRIIPDPDPTRRLAALRRKIA